MGGKRDEIDLKGHLKDLGRYLIALSDAEDNLEIPLFDRFEDKSQPPQEIIYDFPRSRAIAMEEYYHRRVRSEFFPSTLFGEPGWDILLDLFISRINGKRISITSACAASDCPPTTALRWVTVLEDDGLVNRIDDSSDRRRSWVAMSDKGMQFMSKYLTNKNSSSTIRKLRSEINKS